MPHPSTPITPARLTALIDAFAGVRTLVFGDLIADEFIYGADRARVARGAGPDPQLRLDRDRCRRRRQCRQQRRRARRHGRRSSAWPARTTPGQRLLEALRGRVDVRGVVRPRDYRTPTKTRILAGGDALGQAAGRAHRSRGAARSWRTPIAPRVGARLAAAAPTLRRAAGLGLRHRAGHAGAGRAGAAQRCAAAARPPRPSGRLALRAAQVPGHDDLHAERVGGRAAARRHDRRQPAGAREGRPRAAARTRLRRC